MLDYLIIFFCGVYVGTYYECRPAFFYLSTFIKTLAPNRKIPNIDRYDADTTHKQEEKSMKVISEREDKTGELLGTKDNSQNASPKSKKQSVVIFFLINVCKINVNVCI